MHLSHIVKRTYGDVTIGTALTENRLESSVLYVLVCEKNKSVLEYNSFWFATCHYFVEKCRSTIYTLLSIV